MIDLLCLLLTPALLGLANPKKYWYLLPTTILAWVVDVAMNYTVISLISGDGWPRKGEWTFSQRLERLCVAEGPDKLLFIEIAKKLNRVDPLGTHIKAVLLEKS